MEWQNQLAWISTQKYRNKICGVPIVCTSYQMIEKYSNKVCGVLFICTSYQMIEKDGQRHNNNAGKDTAKGSYYVVRNSRAPMQWMQSWQYKQTRRHH